MEKWTIVYGGACCAVALGISALLLAAGFASPAVEDDPPPLRAMTFNIRYSTPDDGENAWPNRKDRAAGMIRFHRVDVAGLQEALKEQIDDLQERLPGYSWIGVGRADGKEAGEFSPIFYRSDRLEALEHDTFWLSETPETPGSKSWDAAIERIATWAVFRDRVRDQELFVLNTHFDHVGEEARLESARLILERVPALAEGRPVVVMGDFNATADSPPYAALTGANDGDTARGPSDGPAPLRDAMLESEEPHHGPNSTWNGFEAIEPGRRIDYIFVNDDIRVLRHGILTDFWDGRFPSDHLPVVADLY